MFLRAVDVYLTCHGKLGDEALGWPDISYAMEDLHPMPRLLEAKLVTWKGHNIKMR